MPKVKFLEHCKTREAVPQEYDAGEVVDLPVASAEHWVSRGKAEYVDQPTRAARVAAAASPIDPQVTPGGPPSKPTPPAPSAAAEVDEPKGDDKTGAKAGEKGEPKSDKPGDKPTDHRAAPPALTTADVKPTPPAKRN